MSEPEGRAEVTGSIEIGGRTLGLHRISAVGDEAAATLPHTVKILLENVLRTGSRDPLAAGAAASLARWPDPGPPSIPFMPARVLMQDFTGVPAVVDLAALRSAVARAGAEPAVVDPSIPVDLVVDHSVQVDAFGTSRSFLTNIDWEYRRNGERYALLKWAQQAFRNFRVVPPGMGICHQVNLEHLARVVQVRDGVAMPDTLLGTDSHTTMVNGIGVLGWGVGGIEAEAAMLGFPLQIAWPVVVGVRMTGALPAGSTATDLVLTLTEMLRAYGVVGKFVEFFGSGLSSLSVEDRATLSNMCPEYGATAAYFPVDAQTLDYLRATGRGDAVELAEAYTREQGLFRTDDDPDPRFSDLLELDLSAVRPSMAGPRRPQDRTELPHVWESFTSAFTDRLVEGERPSPDGVSNGAVVIAAITSCTNTSNPSVMLASGLLARKAVEAGLSVPSWVKTSLAPGSRVVSDYLDRAGLQPYLDKLGFNLVGYGCTTCIGNSGPLPEEVAAEVEARDLVVAAVLSGNRNFEGRIHPQVRASYLASPPLVVAYALAGRLDLDLERDPIGEGADGPVFLRDLWPSAEEIAEVLRDALNAGQFEEQYGRIFDGDDHWRELQSPTGPMYEWDGSSTYVREPPFFDELPEAAADIEGARVLLVLGDSVTTDHISPAGSIKSDSPAGLWLQEQGVKPPEFNSYGARRGNHEVMMRGTFGNTRIRNRLVPDQEGPYTEHQPSGERMFVYEAAMRYREEGVPLVVLGGKEYGSGSSRDWAAKGTALLGVHAVLVESFERIHRSNLIGMGVLPLQYAEGETAESLGLTGKETFAISGLADGVEPGERITVTARADDGTETTFQALARIDNEGEAEIYRQGGILRHVLSGLLGGSG